VPVRVWKTGPVKFAKVLKANANDQPTAAESPHEAIVPQQGTSNASMPAKAWRLHSRLYDDPEEAELGTS
jgi:hypothetical protein